VNEKSRPKRSGGIVERTMLVILQRYKPFPTCKPKTEYLQKLLSTFAPMAMKVAYREWMADCVGEDCQRVGDYLVFPKASTKAEALQIIDKNANKGTKPNGTIYKAAIQGSDLDMLKAQYGDRVAFNDGVVYKFGLANTLVDRHGERFSIPVLKRFADDINESSRTYDWAHMSEHFGLADAFKAELVPHPKYAGETELLVTALVYNDSVMPFQNGRNLVKAIEAGAVKNVSVKFKGWARGEEIKINNEARYVYTYYIDPEDAYTMNTELISIGFVDLGAQHGSNRKSADADKLEFIKENKTMTKTVHIEIGGVQHAIEIEATGDAITVKGVEVAQLAIKTATDAATAKIDGLQKSVELLAAPLVADVVNAKIAGLDEATVKSFAPEKLIATATEVAKAVAIKQPEKEVSESKKAVDSLKW